MNINPTRRKPRASNYALFRSFVAVALGLLLSASSYAAQAAKKSFDLPAGEAITTLKQFMSQADTRLLYPIDALKDVQTSRL